MLYFFKKIKKKTWRYHYFTPMYQKSWWYDLQFLRYRVWQTEIGNYGSLFNLKNQNFQRMKKIAGDIILLHRYSYWDTEWDRYMFLITLGHFFPFYRKSKLSKNENQNFSQKIKTWQKMTKASAEIIILHMCTKYHDHIMYASWDMECDRHNCHFEPFFPFFAPLMPKIKIWKKRKKKTISRYHYFTQVYHKWQSYDVWVLRYGVWQT